MSTVSRQELYTQVWAEPMTKVAKTYGVSSNYLARICEQLNVPRPPRGYWQQLAAGRAEDIPDLPEPDPGDEQDWIRGVDPYGRQPPPPIHAPPTERRSRRPERSKTHPVLVGVREDFEDSKQASYNDDGYLKPKKHALPDLFVSKNGLQAALRLANRLFMALEDQGHWVRIAAQGFRYDVKKLEPREGSAKRNPYDETRSWRGNPPTLAFVSGVAIGLTIFETAEYVDVVYEDGKFVRAPTTRAFLRQRELESWRAHKGFVPSGRMGIFAYAPYGGVEWTKHWREEAPGSLSEMVDTIAAELEAAAPTLVELFEDECRQAEERRRRLEAQQKKWAEEEAEKRRKEEEGKRLQRLETAIQGWRMARDIREYVAAQVAMVAEANLEITEGGGLDRDLKWALAYADKVDPLGTLRAEIARTRKEHDDECSECRTTTTSPNGTAEDRAAPPGAPSDGKKGS